MNNRKRVMEFAVLLLITGMGTTPAGARDPNEEELQKMAEAYNAKKEAPAQEVVCKQEARVGSRIKRPVCRTKGTLEVEKWNIERVMNRPRPKTTSTIDPYQF